MSDVVNMQVRAGDSARVATAVRQVLGPLHREAARKEAGGVVAHPHAAGLDLAAAAGDRTLISPPLRGWVGVYDTLLEGSGDHTLEHVACALAGALDSVVLTVRAHEGKVLMYWLCRGGQCLDRFNSWPDFFRPVARDVWRKWKGRPAVLAGACGAPEQAFALRRVLRQGNAGATAMLREVSRLLGPGNLTQGYATLQAPEDPRSIEGWERFLRLGLKEYAPVGR